MFLLVILQGCKSVDVVHLKLQKEAFNFMNFEINFCTPLKTD